MRPLQTRMQCPRSQRFIKILNVIIFLRNTEFVLQRQPPYLTVLSLCTVVHTVRILHMIKVLITPQQD